MTRSLDIEFDSDLQYIYQFHPYLYQRMEFSIAIRDKKQKSVSRREKAVRMYALRTGCNKLNNG